MNLDKVTEWVIDHRRDKAFVGYKKEDIRTELESAYLQNTLEVSHDNEGNINGVIVAEPRLHIKQILTAQEGVFYKLCYLLNLKFYGLTWQGYRDTEKKKLKLFPNIDAILSLIKRQLRKKEGK